MSSNAERVEVYSGIQRRRRCSVDEKLRIVQEASQPGITISYVARRHGITPSLLFHWRRRMAEGGKEAVRVLRQCDGTVILTGTNADPGGGSIRRALASFADEYPDRVVFAESLGSRRYLSLISYIDVVIGNSSSGLLEVPAVGVPSVAIGARQLAKNRITPYGRPGVARRIADVLESASLDSLEKPVVNFRSQPTTGSAES
jgi:hypothetical protein